MPADAASPEPLLYVYGVVDADRAPRVRGIVEAPVRTVAAGNIAALVSALPQLERVALGRDELRAHAAVLEEALRGGSVLPMRFGVVMESEDAVRERLLLPRQAELRRQLDELEGKVEMRLRATYREQVLMGEVVRENPRITELRQAIRGRPDEATHHDRIRLGELAAQAVSAKRRADTSALLAALEPLAWRSNVLGAGHERVALHAAFLIERARRAEFNAAAEALAAEQHGRLQLKLSGPLPPYSFAGLAQEPPG